MLILAEFCTLNILKAKISEQSLSEHAIRELENVYLCSYEELIFSQLRVFTCSVGKLNILFHIGTEGLQRLSSSLEREGGFLQIYCLHTHRRT